MGKTISVYVNDKDLTILDRLARTERRSRSAMLGEVIRRYMILSKNPKPNLLARSFSSSDLQRFLKEDKKISPKKIEAARRKLDLNSH